VIDSAAVAVDLLERVGEVVDDPGAVSGGGDGGWVLADGDQSGRV
jgi:hypothetical protein